MNHLVLRRKGDFSSISIVHSDVELFEEFESWALIDGAQIIFVNNKMHALLKNYYMAGSYSTSAVYLYAFEELYAILTSYLGKSDRVRYEAMTNDRYNVHWAKYELAAYFTVKSASLAGKLFWMGIKFIGLMLIIPFFISIFNRTK